MSMVTRQHLSDVLRSAKEISANPAMAAADWLARDIDPQRSSAAELLTDPARVLAIIAGWELKPPAAQPRVSTTVRLIWWTTRGLRCSYSRPQVKELKSSVVWSICGSPCGRGKSPQPPFTKGGLDFC